MYLFMAELSSGVPAVFASGEVWESKFPFQTKKRKERANKKKRKRHARKDLEQTGRGQRGGGGGHSRGSTLRKPHICFHFLAGIPGTESDEFVSKDNTGTQLAPHLPASGPLRRRSPE